MGIPDGQTLGLHDGVLVEATPGGDRLVLWLPAGDPAGADWERVANVAHAEVVVERGIGATAATAVRARKRSRGVFGRLVGRVMGGAKDRELTLPTGETAERVGARRTDLMLAWAVGEGQALNEVRLRERWPLARGFRAIGRNLVLVEGVVAREARPQAPATPEEGPGTPTAEAERALEAARATGDRLGELSALTDLGIIRTNEGKSGEAVTLLERARGLAVDLGDRSRESDVVGYLGLATLAAGQPRRTLELLDRGLALAREAGDWLAEKLALERLGMAFAHVPDHARALGYFEQALAIARAVGDRPHEAALRWQVATELAELGRRAEAVAEAQGAIDLFDRLGRPEGRRLAEDLRRFREGDAGAFAGGSIVVGAAAAPAVAARSSGPGLLRIALSAAQAAARYVGSGFQTVGAEALRRRLDACGACEHHTGLRCRVCGCFTGAKARLPHEDCPLGKWPS